jgi:hypothetical protein
LRLLGGLLLIALLPLPAWLQSLLPALVLVSAAAWFFVSKQGKDQPQQVM